MLKKEGGVPLTVKVYSTKTCPWCVKVKEYLDSLHVAFDEVDVSADREAAMELVKKTKQMGVPVTQIEDRFIVGYDPGSLETCLREAGLL